MNPAPQLFYLEISDIRFQISDNDKNGITLFSRSGIQSSCPVIAVSDICYLTSDISHESVAVI
jgi:hypothetical protein